MTNPRGGLTIICGHGRSGTNLLLDVLDTHPLTNCRNEPDVLSNSLLRKREINVTAIDHDPELEPRLRSALEAMRFTKGNRDKFRNGHKSYIKLGFKIGLFDFMLTRRSTLALASVALKRLRNDEWDIPQFCINQSVAQSVELVAKLVQSYRTCSQLLEQGTSIKVLHIVRDPVEVLKSWESRYLALADQDEVKRKNYERLTKILKVEPGWSKLFGDINKLNAHESEFLYWMYGNETLFRQGTLDKNYFQLPYSSLVNAPDEMAQEIFSFLGLSFDADCIKRVKGLRNLLFKPLNFSTNAPIQFIQDKMKSSSLRFKF